MESRFYKYADLIIDFIEGGYYNPIRHNTNGMGSSGETMFGMDRANGGTIFDSEIGREFWRIIDANSATWPWNYFGGHNEARLRKIAADIMGQSYDKYSNLFLSPESRVIVAKSPKLETHFYYACWNGPGRFQAFANIINDAVKQGPRKLSELENIALQSRLNHSVQLIRKGGALMRDKIWPNLPGKAVWPWLLIAAGLLFLTLKK